MLPAHTDGQRQIEKEIAVSYQRRALNRSGHPSGARHASPVVARESTTDVPPVGSSNGGGRKWTPVFVAGGIVGVLVLLWAEVVTGWMTQLMPFGWEVRSAGTDLPSFEESFPPILRFHVLVAALAGMAALAVRMPNNRFLRVAHATRRAPLEMLLTIVAMVLYAWLSWPHLASPSNSRIHWVDIFFQPRIDNYWYTLVKLPHAIFYDYPWVWQSLNAGINISLVMFLVRRATARRDLSLGAGVAFLVAGQVLLFSSTAEDVQICFTAILAFMTAYQARRPVAVGVCLWVLMLARPQFLVAVPAYLLVEYALTPGGSIRRLALTRSARVTMAVFTALFVGWHLWLNLRGTGWLLTEGQILVTGLNDVAPKNIDGFTISPFSGAYAAHFLWLFPLPILLFLLTSWGAFRRSGEARTRVVAWSVLFSAFTILLSEVEPVMYFNARYITYAFLPLVMSAFLLFPSRFPRVGVGRPLSAALLVMLSVATIAFPHRELLVRENTHAKPLIVLYSHRFDLQQAAQGRHVFVDVDHRQQRHQVAYALKASINQQRVVTDETEEVGPGILVTTSDGHNESWDVVLRTADVGVYILDEPVDAQMLTHD